MTPPPHSPSSVRRVVLPSGKTIEIVYFTSVDADAPAQELHICPDCASHLVYPTDWEERGEASWDLALRCPNCEWEGGGVYEHTAVEQLDENLDSGTRALVADLRQLSRANMEEEVERFVSALQADAVLPMDF